LLSWQKEIKQSSFFISFILGFKAMKSAFVLEKILGYFDNNYRVDE